MTSRRISYESYMSEYMISRKIESFIYLLHWDKVVFDWVQQVDKVMKVMENLESLVVLVVEEDLDDKLLILVD